MKKVILIGGSFFNPSYLNGRIYGDENKLDDHSFQDIIQNITQCEVKSLGINGTGNEWPINALLTNQNYIDKETTVIIHWAPVDRIDLHFDSTKHNKDIQFPEKEKLPPHVQNELSFYRTYGLDGNVVDSGFRFYSTGPAYPTVKRNYYETCYSEPYHLKKCYEAIVFAQNFLKDRCYRQIHMCPWDFELYREIHLLGGKGYFASKHRENKYVWLEFPEPHFNLIEEYPELKYWKDLIDWNLFTDNYLNYFCDEHLPYWGGFNGHNIHQVPLNNYKFISSQFFEDKIDRTDEYIEATITHCKKYDIEYPIMT